MWVSFVHIPYIKILVLIKGKALNCCLAECFFLFSFPTSEGRYRYFICRFRLLCSGFNVCIAWREKIFVLNIFFNFACSFCSYIQCSTYPYQMDVCNMALYLFMRNLLVCVGTSASPSHWYLLKMSQMQEFATEKIMRVQALVLALLGLAQCIHYLGSAQLHHTSNLTNYKSQSFWNHWTICVWEMLGS